MNKFAIIGCGHISLYHAECIATSAQLLAVCDTNTEKAQTLARQFNCKPYFSIDLMLKEESDVDIVVICTPNGFHAEHAIKSLQAGRHVLCENPLCITSAAAWQIIETEKFSAKKLFVVNASRYIPLLQNLKKLIDDNLLGAIYNFQLNCFNNRPTAYYTEWRGKKFPGGGTLYTEYSHYVDVLLWLFGNTAEIKGFVANAAHKGVIEFEDTGTVAVKMQNDILGTINWSANAMEKNEEIRLAIITEKGSISIGGEYLSKLIYHNLHNPFLFETGNNFKDHNTEPINFYKEIYTHLFKAADSSNNYLSNSFEGLKTVETIERIYKAVNPL